MKVVHVLNSYALTNTFVQVRFIDFYLKAQVPVNDLRLLPTVLGEVPVLTFTAATISCGSEGGKIAGDNGSYAVCARLLPSALLSPSFIRDDRAQPHTHPLCCDTAAAQRAILHRWYRIDGEG